MDNITQEWFEMAELRRRSIATKVWIPLAASHVVHRVGEAFYAGYQEEYFGCETVAVPLALQAEAEQLEWDDLSNNGQKPQCLDEKYLSADEQTGYGDEVIGIRLVLRQTLHSPDTDEWHLHQDLVLALGLKREGDKWVCPQEGYPEVARLTRKATGEPALLDIRAEHLRDYLQARKMGLLASTFTSREAVTPSASYITWPGDYVEQQAEGQRWVGSTQAVHEGGMLFGAEMNVVHIGRTNVDKGEDIPAFSVPAGKEVSYSSSIARAGNGRLLMLVKGHLWRTEWLEPASTSPRVRQDATPGIAHFITDTAGTQETKETLGRKGNWLWFKPQVVNDLAQHRGGAMGWYTRETGWVSAVYGNQVLFGLNALGLLNVYAKDIGQLPDWQQKIWAGHSSSPEGGVSAELLASQAEALPADTEAPEVRLARVLTTLSSLTEEKLGFKLFRPHADYEAIVSRTHRFRATDYPSLLALAKDVARITADSIDSGALLKFLPPLPKGERPPGSLKSLEKYLATKIPVDKARSLLTALVGIYELRLGDAHLPSSRIAEAWALVGIDDSLPFVWQAEALLTACAAALEAIEQVILSHAESTSSAT